MGWCKLDRSRQTRFREGFLHAAESVGRGSGWNDGIDPGPLICGLAMGHECYDDIRSEEGSAMEITTIGIDLAKSVFAISAADARGKVLMRKQLRRAQVVPFLRQRKPCVVGMEACGGAHYWARAIARLGHPAEADESGAGGALSQG